MAVTIIVADGIGTHGTTSGIIDKTAAGIMRSLGESGVESESVWVDYPASMAGVGGSVSWNTSASIGVADMRREVEVAVDSGDKVVLLGYSGGNKVVRNFLDDAGAFSDDIISVGLMSDPWRPAGKYQYGTQDPGGFGIMGQKPIGPWADRTYWTSVKGDPISSGAPDSLLRYLADACEGDPDKLIADFIQVARQGRFQLAPHLGLPVSEWFFGLGDRIGRSIGEASNYLSGYHTTRYVLPYIIGTDHRSLADRLADTISFKVRRML